MQLIYCQMTQNRLSETKACVERTLPHVDHIVIVDGGSIDESIIYFRNWSHEEPKLHFYLHPWKDNFPEQRTNYLKHAGKFAKDGDFILVSDPDELFEEKAMASMKTLCQKITENKQWNSASFQCRSVSLRGNKRVWESMDQYWKHLLYQWHPTMHYVGNPHETLIVPYGLSIVQTDLVYEHIKQDNVIWIRGYRNFTIGGGGPNLGNRNPIWLEWKQICKDNNIPQKWHDHEQYLLKGNIHQKLKDWMIKYHDVSGFDGSSEVREGYKTYFRILHPEEEPVELKDKHIP
jgi:glycosyltransferase involved in cell wall biosynthesis